jgi:hypothetical protein
MPAASFNAVEFSKSDLDRVDQRIAQARVRLERQRGIIEKLAVGGHGTTDAESLFRVMRRTLENFEKDRRAIEDEMFAARPITPRPSPLRRCCACIGRSGSG